MAKLEEELTQLYPDESLSESDIQDMTDNLKRFCTLCLTIFGQDKSPKEVQGNQQKNVQNADFMG